MKILLINPKPDCPSFFGDEVMEGTGIITADNTSPTVAACIPTDIEVEICDERVSPVNYATDADWIGLTGRLSQHRNQVSIARAFKAKGKKILAGGSFAARFSESIKPYCDVIVKGEIEDIAPTLFNDLKNNSYQREYIGTRPRLVDAPVPRWDLYPIKKALSGSVQTGRGCPFSCDFCDIVQFNGQEMRSKSIASVLRELDALYHTYNLRSVFLTDDNLVGNVSYAKELFTAIREWRQDKEEMTFIAQTPEYIAQNFELESETFM